MLTNNTEIITVIDSNNDKKPGVSSLLKKIVYLAGFLFICIIIAYVLSQALFATVPISGPSMQPTLYAEDRVLLYKVGNYRYGDVVVFKSELQDEEGNDRYLVKRIIGLPGDVVEIRLVPSGQYSVFLNGVKLMEDYLADDEERAEGIFEEMTVPEGKFFYLGDNRNQSADSRTGLMGNIDDIVGRAILKYHGTDFFNGLTPIPRVKA